MQLNPDCVREVLLVIRDIPRGESLTCGEIHKILDEFFPDDVDYTCLKLQEAGLINAKIKILPNHNFVLIRLYDLTMMGQELAECVAPKKVWDKIKKKFNNIYQKTLPALIQIALQFKLNNFM